MARFFKMGKARAVFTSSGADKTVKKNGNSFCGCQRKTICSLRNLFEPVKDDIAYICENGAMVVYKGKILHKDVFERALAEEMVHSILNREDMEIIVSGEKSYYIQPKRKAFADYMLQTVKGKVAVVDDIFKVKEDILKISMYRESGLRNAALLEKAFRKSGNCGNLRSRMAGYDADECG